MTNAELIAALRWCQTHGCSKCVALLESGSCKYGGAIKIFEAAADALEAAEQRIAELERILKAVQENSGINFRLWQEAEAQLPTEIERPSWCPIKGEISEIELMHLEEERAFAARNIAAERSET